MAEPALTRRSSRRRNAETAASASAEPTAPVEATAAAVVEVALGAATLLSPAAAPLSRRAARARQVAAAKVEPEVSPVARPVVDAVPEASPTESVDSPVEPAADAEPEVAAASDADAFADACRAFQTSRTDEARESVEDSLPAEATTVHVAARKRRSRSKAVAFGATVGVMGVAGMLAVSMTLPAEAVAAARGTQAVTATSLIAATQAPASESGDDEIQAFVASSDLQNDMIQRAEDFSTASLIDIAAERGIDFSSELYTNNPDAAIQWPFVIGVGMSSGYGARNGRMHEGIDLVPGAGAPIQSIADGTVRIATEAGGNYGVTAYVDHVIDGKVITSHYSHMQYGSLRVAPGQKIKVGDIIGNVGNTGRSYGAHLHFELILDGTKIDPLPWMQENAGRLEY